MKSREPTFMEWEQKVSGEVRQGITPRTYLYGMGTLASTFDFPISEGAANLPLWNGNSFDEAHRLSESRREPTFMEWEL